MKWPRIKHKDGKRQTPYRHQVRAHIRQGFHVNSYMRGLGDPTPHSTLKKVTRPKGGYSFDDIRNIHATRSIRARKIDEKLRAPISKSYNEWIHAPNKSDVTGVDTPKKGGGYYPQKYHWARMSMNRMGGIIRVDALEKKSNEVETLYFETEEDARIFINKVKKLEKKPEKMKAEATYNKATGWIQIKFEEKPDRKILDELKAEGFRYRPKSRTWAAKANSVREELIEKLAGKIEEVSYEVDPQKRAEKYQRLADKYKKQADEYYESERKILSVIPPGQPILVGHHSERRHRRDLERAERNRKKGMEARELAEKYQRLANEQKYIVEKGENPKTIYNRIKKLESEERSLKRQIEEYKESEPKWVPERKKTLERVQYRLGIERRKYKEVGGLPSEKVELKVGMRVNTFGGPAIIQKVSNKSVRVNFENPALKSYNWKGGYKIDKSDITKVFT